MEFALASLESYKAECLHVSDQNPNVTISDDVFCLADCNNQGQWDTFSIKAIKATHREILE